MLPETVRIEPREGGVRLRGYASLAAISRARAGTSMAFVVSTRITVPIPIGTSYSASKFGGRSRIT
jgi:hypothetical protein